MALHSLVSSLRSWVMDLPWPETPIEWNPQKPEEYRDRHRQRGERILKRAHRAIERGEWDSARFCFEASAASMRESGYLEGEIESLIGLGRSLSRAGDKVGALACLKRASGMSCGSNDLSIRFRCSMVMGDVWIEQKHPWMALACYREALIQRGRPEHPRDFREADSVRNALVEVLRDKIAQGRLNIAEGHLLEARRHYHEGLNLARDPLFEPFSMPVFPYHISHYENLIRVELAHLALRLAQTRTTDHGGTSFVVSGV